MRFAACIGTIVLGLLGALDPAVSQRAAPGSSAPSGGGAASSAEERAARLRAIVGLVTMPDQAMNIANFEQVVESGDARKKMEDWLTYYNEVRPHGAIGNKPPISLQNSGGATSQPP